MPRIAYFDCISGASGDMILGAIVDCGLTLERLSGELALLNLAGYALRAERVQRAGLSATRVHVELDDAPQPARTLADVLAIIEASALPHEDRERGAAVFHRLAEAEAKVHGVGIDEIHFHEVGAVDAIVDVMGAIAGLRLLGAEACFCSPLPLGSGSAQSQHGRIPVPGPATLELLSRAGAPVREDRGERGELLTPTGAAILTTLAQFERPAITMEQVGYGAGARNPADAPNVLRLWFGKSEDRPARRILQIETNIDDMPAEYFGYVQERLFAAGALDVWFTPVQMKKNRPATMLALLCPISVEAEIVDVLLTETSTLGVRMWEVRRHEAERQMVRFPSSLGDAAVKVKRLATGRARIAPEYDSCREIARAAGMPLPEVYQTIAREAEAWLATHDGGGP
jgi:uncharacterized protein (TIGR00299 family) protein